MTDPRIPRSLRGYEPERRTPAVDPLGWCVIATTALLTLLAGAPVLAVFAMFGFAKYWRAWRSGNDDTACILGDIRLVLVYLAALTAVGLVATVIRFT
jgi:hypothetical protein